MMQAGICILPLLPLRSEPSERAEMVSQILFGELLEVLDEKNSWIYIRNLSDSYTGWCTRKMLQLLPLSIFETLRDAEPTFTRLLLSSCVRQGEAAPQLFLPAGSRLYFLDQKTGTFPLYKTRTIGHSEPQKEYWSVNLDTLGISEPLSEFINPSELVKTALLFMNAPYLWGGKSILGIDCSGLIQLVFSMFGLHLPRDARDQALLGEPVLHLSEALAGDLAFFTNADEKVVHVGLLLDNRRIIHASGCVHIDSIDYKGIFSESLGLYTHKLYSIRRLFRTDTVR